MPFPPLSTSPAGRLNPLKPPNVPPCDSPPSTSSLHLVSPPIPLRLPSFVHRALVHSARNDSPFACGGLSLARVVEQIPLPALASFCRTPGLLLRAHSFSLCALPSSIGLPPPPVASSHRYNDERYFFSEPLGRPTAAVSHSLTSATRRRTNFTMYYLRRPRLVGRPRPTKSCELRRRTVSFAQWWWVCPDCRRRTSSIEPWSIELDHRHPCDDCSRDEPSFRSHLLSTPVPKLRSLHAAVPSRTRRS